ncbi:anti-sigma factor antagonist [Candidatus Omnitrophota bacterium]
MAQEHVMKIRVRNFHNIAILSVEGKININSSKLIETVGSILDKGITRIVINMEHVDFVDYNGLSVLAITYKSALNAKASMKLCGILPHILELLKVVRLDEVFDIHENLEAAIGDLKKKPKKQLTGKATPTQKKEQHRRRFSRLDLDIPIHYGVDKGSGHKIQDISHVGRIANLSGAGLFIRTMNLLQPGICVNIKITFNSAKKPKHIKGVVMWLADKGLQPDLYPGMGVAFTGISTRKQEEIITYIEKHAVHRRS